jgi:hypothetical protein
MKCVYIYRWHTADLRIFRPLEHLVTPQNICASAAGSHIVDQLQSRRKFRQRSRITLTSMCGAVSQILGRWNVSLAVGEMSSAGSESEHLILYLIVAPSRSFS